MVDVPKKVSSYIILAALVQKLVFQDGASSHLRFGPLAENTRIFEREIGTKYFIKGP